MAQNKNKKQKTPDSNLALISVILGGAAIFGFFTILTGIPAIILGIIALRKNAGNRTLAKLGIGFGVVGSLLIIPIIMLAVHFLRQPFSEQFSLTRDDRVHIKGLVDKLNEYKEETGSYPLCSDAEPFCEEWETFLYKHPYTVIYPIAFESDPYNVEDRPVNTLVYVNRSVCFINTPTTPGSLDEDDKNEDPTKFASLVYFHEKGRACFNVHGY